MGAWIPSGTCSGGLVCFSGLLRAVSARDWKTIYALTWMGSKGGSQVMPSLMRTGWKQLFATTAGDYPPAGTVSDRVPMCFYTLSGYLGWEANVFT